MVLFIWERDDLQSLTSFSSWSQSAFLQNLSCVYYVDMSGKCNKWIGKCFLWALDQVCAVSWDYCPNTVLWLVSQLSCAMDTELWLVDGCMSHETFVISPDLFIIISSTAQWKCVSNRNINQDHPQIKNSFLWNGSCPFLHGKTLKYTLQLINKAVLVHKSMFSFFYCLIIGLLRVFQWVHLINYSEGLLYIGEQHQLESNS